ncbi:hypothetical protein QBC37DRAFT_181132 [Rhypophila decipiens]|uniref:Uncharacterized protein n=1 Tax=Rhypophila decipiens TaxID=261697 RepID=A0AAN7B526_9PEZI|nr:hypothetical protein QBC37DRAFT_181132 [Rhypophila decipiens]
MAWDWHGNVTTIVVVIAVVGCFSWIPVVLVVSLVQKGKRKLQTTSGDEEKKNGQHPKQPEIEKPPPVVPKGLERSASTWSHGTASTGDPLRRWDTGSSWDPVKPPLKRWDSASTISPTAKQSSVRSNSNFSRPPLPQMQPSSRPSSVRSVASLKKGPGAIPAGSRRGSINSIVGVSPRGGLQVEKAYYDTTPLPETPAVVARPLPETPTVVPRAANFARPIPPRTQSRASSVTPGPASFEIPRSPPGRKSEDFSRPRPSIDARPRPSMDEQLRAPQPRRVSVNSQMVQTMQQVQEEQAWWESQAAADRQSDSPPPLGQAM